MVEGNINPDCLERVKKFQRMFVGYFPHLEEIQLAAIEWSWLHSRWTLNDITTVRRRQELENLERVIQALRVLAKSDWWPWWMTIYEARRVAEADDADRVTQDLGFIAAALIELGHINSPNEEEAPARLESALDRFRKRAVEEMSRLPDTGNTNWDAVFAVDSLRIVWWRNTDFDAPAKALNPASEFAAFLQDGFVHLEVSANPIAAFRRWVAWSSTIDRT
jgi:hypothetical protein